MNKLPTRRTVRVIDTSSGEERLKCPECGAREMHIYKKDPSLYFCGSCANTIPVVKVKRDTAIGPIHGDNSKGEQQKTFIAQVPRNRKLHRPETVMESNLRSKGYDIQDYYEMGPD